MKTNFTNVFSNPRIAQFFNNLYYNFKIKVILNLNTFLITEKIFFTTAA